VKNIISAFAVGFIFAIGLGLSGMTQPQKVIGFLDLFGAWDPSLMFVMIGAISVHFVTYRLIRRRNSPLFATKWYVPEKREITPALVIGSLIFGIGWGLAGYCPGPAVTALSSFSIQPVLFVAAMLAGMTLFRIIDRKVHFKK
jgi:uncharacterized membrane protein YedE/YeeE